MLPGMKLIYSCTHHLHQKLVAHSFPINKETNDTVRRFIINARALLSVNIKAIFSLALTYIPAEFFKVAAAPSQLHTICDGLQMFLLSRESYWALKKRCLEHLDNYYYSITSQLKMRCNRSAVLESQMEVMWSSAQKLTAKNDCCI